MTKYVIFAVLLIIPNIFMHAKSGMVERYLVPTTFGISFFATGLLESTKQQFFRILAIAAIVVFLFNSFIISRAAAVQFANTGKDTNAFFSVIKKQTSPQTKILLVLDPVDRYEVTYSIRAYLGTYGISEIYGYPVMREYTTDFEKGLKTRWQTWFENKSLADMKNPPDLIVVFDKNQTDAFFASAKIQRDLYENVFSESTLHAIFAKRK